jgi:hypothetical protein
VSHDRDHDEHSKEGEIMSSTGYSAPSPRGEEFRISLMLGALFPFFLTSVVVLRAMAWATKCPATGKSVLREAWENFSIAISYALMARAMLQSFARD